MSDQTSADDVAKYVSIFLPLFDRIVGLFSAMFAHSGGNAEAHAMLAETKAAHAELAAHCAQANAVKHGAETSASDQA
jgi:hypothetical protein